MKEAEEAATRLFRLFVLSCSYIDRLTCKSTAFRGASWMIEWRIDPAS
jgi:hypothetical protein